MNALTGPPWELHPATGYSTSRDPPASMLPCTLGKEGTKIVLVKENSHCLATHVSFERPLSLRQLINSLVKRGSLQSLMRPISMMYFYQDEYSFPLFVFVFLYFMEFSSLKNHKLIGHLNKCVANFRCKNCPIQVLHYGRVCVRALCMKCSKDLSLHLKSK